MSRVNTAISFVLGSQGISSVSVTANKEQDNNCTSLFTSVVDIQVNIDICSSRSRHPKNKAPKKRFSPSLKKRKTCASSRSAVSSYFLTTQLVVSDPFHTPEGPPLTLNENVPGVYP